MSINIELKRPRNISDSEWAELTADLKQDLEDDTPVKTGNMKASWSVGGSVSNFVDYANFVNKGTVNMAPRDITPPAVARFQAIVDHLSESKRKK